MLLKRSFAALISRLEVYFYFIERYFILFAAALAQLCFTQSTFGSREQQREGKSVSTTGNRSIRISYLWWKVFVSQISFSHQKLHFQMQLRLFTKLHTNSFVLETLISFIFVFFVSSFGIQISPISTWERRERKKERGRERGDERDICFRYFPQNWLFLLCYSRNFHVKHTGCRSAQISESECHQNARADCKNGITG